MEEIIKEQKKLSQKASYGSSIDEIDQLIQQLTTARNTISNAPQNAPAQLVRLNQSAKKSFDGMNNNLRGLSSSLKSYAKVLDKVNHLVDE
jgi:predicted PurR-regulated permease PerM